MNEEIESIIVPEDRQDLARLFLFEGESNYLDKKNSFLTRVQQQSRSMSQKMAWKRQRVNFMQGIRKHYNSSRFDRAKERVEATLDGIRNSAKFSNKTSDTRDDKRDGEKRKDPKDPKDIRDIRDKDKKKKKKSTEETNEANEGVYLLPVSHYQDFQLISEVSELLAAVSETNRVLEMEEVYVEKSLVGLRLVEALSCFLRCIAERSDGDILVPQKTMETIWDALG